jgi:Cft2 family RNA processing exonuclease
MTHPTKAVMKLLLADNLKLQTKSKPLYSEQDLQKCIDKIEYKFINRKYTFVS